MNKIEIKDCQELIVEICEALDVSIIDRELILDRIHELKNDLSFECITKIKELKDALESANENCRSAMQIAKREGASTNWNAFKVKLSRSLHHQHLVMRKYRIMKKRIQTELNHEED